MTAPQPAGWTAAELARIGATTEIQLASRKPDGTVGPFTTMWIGQTGEGLYVRSAGGPDRPWYRRARASGNGRLRAAGAEYDVTFGDADPAVQDALDAALHAKYDRHGPGPVGHITGPDTHALTIELHRSGS